MNRPPNHDKAGPGPTTGRAQIELLKTKLESQTKSEFLAFLDECRVRLEGIDQQARLDEEVIATARLVLQRVNKNPTPVDLLKDTQEKPPASNPGSTVNRTKTP